MTFLKWIFGGGRQRNRRRYKRFEILDGAYVVVGSSYVKGEPSLLLDAGLGGLSFVPGDSDGAIPDSGELSILADNVLWVDQVPFEVVYDSEGTVSAEPLKNTRRKGVRFTCVNALDRHILADFIEKHRKNGK